MLLIEIVVSELINAMQINLHLVNQLDYPNLGSFRAPTVLKIFQLQLLLETFLYVNWENPDESS